MIKHASILAVLCLAASVVACSSGPDLKQITIEAIEAGDAQSFRSEGTQTIVQEGDTQSYTFEGEYAAPDRSRGKSTYGDEWNEFIVIGDDAYVRSEDEPDWRLLDSQSGGYPSQVTSRESFVSVPLSDGLEPLKWLTGIDRLTDEDIDGADCLHYRGKVDADAWVDALVEEMDPPPTDGDPTEVFDNMRRWTTTCRLWVGKADQLIRQLTITTSSPVGDPQAEPENWSLSVALWRFYDFDQPIEINPPEL
jgi:hypothetical protein